MLVGWAFVWPHLAWQLASKAIDPLHSEYTNLKADAILAGMWMGIMGINLLAIHGAVDVICINLMGAGGCVFFIAGAVLMGGFLPGDVTVNGYSRGF